MHPGEYNMAANEKGNECKDLCKKKYDDFEVGCEEQAENLEQAYELGKKDLRKI